MRTGTNGWRTTSFNSRAREGREVHRFGGDPVGGVSIHAPARGATQKFRACAALQAVSIHAPARGATVGSERSDAKRLCFNSRAREGRDGLRRYGESGAGVSIHAPARGATSPGRSPRSRRCFNSRAREGRDFLPPVDPAPEYVSIHAPARGATAPRLPKVYKLAVSIHAPARGATVMF